MLPEVGGGASQGGNGTNNANDEIAAPFSDPLPLPWTTGSLAVKLSGVVVSRRRVSKLLVFVTIVPHEARLSFTRYYLFVTIRTYH